MFARALDRVALWSAYHAIQLMHRHRGAWRGDVRFQQGVFEKGEHREPLFRRRR